MSEDDAVAIGVYDDLVAGGLSAAAAALVGHLVRKELAIAPADELFAAKIADGTGAEHLCVLRSNREGAIRINIAGRRSGERQVREIIERLGDDVIELIT